MGRRLTIREGSPVIDAALSPDGRWLVSVHRQDSLARLWRVADGSLVGGVEHQGPILSVAWSPDGRWMATVAEDRTLSLWSHDGYWLHTFSCGRSRPNFVRFSQDGRYLLFEYHWPSRNKQALIIPLDPEGLRSMFDQNLFYPLPKDAITNKQSLFINQFQPEPQR